MFCETQNLVRRQFCHLIQSEAPATKWFVFESLAGRLSPTQTQDPAAVRRTTVRHQEEQGCLAGLGPPGFLQAFHHPDGDAVLDAAAGVEVLALGVQLTGDVGPDVVEANDGRVAHDL